MHSQGGGQIASSMEVTEELQDLMFEGNKLQFPFKSVLVVAYII